MTGPSPLSHIVATFFRVGHLPVAPGTWGSLAALPFGWLLHGLGGPWLLGAGAVLAFALGWWATAAETRGRADHDPGEIVIDEVAGQWIALLPLSWGLAVMGADPWVFPWPGVLAAFLLFRIFDMWKPGPIGWADRLHTPLGVMLDDVLAGIAAGAVLLAGAALAHGWLA